MADNIIMPQLGESIAEGTIVKWLKKPGDEVKKDENILLISTDKVEAEIPSPSAGVLLSITVDQGQTVAVGTVLGQVGQANEKASANTAIVEDKKSPVDKLPSSAPPTPSLSETQVTSTQAGEDSIILGTSANTMSNFFSPLVRRIASEHGVQENELASINGSGHGGRVSKKDILDYLSTRGNKAPSNALPQTQAVSNQAPYSALQGEIIASDRQLSKPISTMRRVIIENMLASRATSAHVTTFFEIDYTAIDKVRMAHKDQFKKDEQVSLTYTTFLTAAVCQVLKRHPYINASLTKDSIIFKKDIHLGIAVSIENPEPGLMVPVIKHADKQNLRGLAHTIADLSQRVRARKIKPDELSGGTFTITNPGNYGALIGTPIINQPQVAILGVGQISKQARVLEVDGTDVIAIRRMGLLGLSFDHRLIDGATADIFMADLKNTLENWTATP
ncbi:MAG: 2-oxo acid dehydrogenase subunit E2 [Myxococcales bacterium]|nr:MAG: 2-oxo acid dehydrogenase subunit E2 [Myxococcales bacterium]